MSFAFDICLSFLIIRLSLLPYLRPLFVISVSHPGVSPNFVRGSAGHYNLYTIIETALHFHEESVNEHVLCFMRCWWTCSYNLLRQISYIFVSLERNSRSVIFDHFDVPKLF